MMSIRHWISSPRVQRALALSAVVLSLGGLILLQAPSSAPAAPSPDSPEAVGKHLARFSGPGAEGTLALSHSAIPANESHPVFAELRVRATESGMTSTRRAPLSLAVLLDTSGSMSGVKHGQAVEAVTELLEGMEPRDEIALIQYNSVATLIQPLAPIGEIRSSVIRRVTTLAPGGGTNIPRALQLGLASLEDAAEGRVKRVVLVSDGLDSTKTTAVRLATDATERQVTVSSLGIGLNFDESYMSAVADAGRGNFAFVQNGEALASFLKRELKETARTTIQSATAHLTLPSGARFVRAVGARAVTSGSGVDLHLGSLYEGDERRVVVELAAVAEQAETLAIQARMHWRTLGGGAEESAVPQLALVGTQNRDRVSEGRDVAIYASCLSAVASVRQMEAADAYRRGDTATAYGLIAKNKLELDRVAAIAPSDLQKTLREQNRAYGDDLTQFRNARPRSPAGKAAAKQSAARDHMNLSRKAY